MQDNFDDPQNWVKLDNGVTDAANYQIGLYSDDGSAADAFTTRERALEAILFEHMLELGTKGHRFWDVVRFGGEAEIFGFFIEAEKGRFDYLDEAVYTEVPNSYLPIPRDAIDRSLKNGVPTLKQNPGY